MLHRTLIISVAQCLSVCILLFMKAFILQHSCRATATFFQYKSECAQPKNVHVLSVKIWLSNIHIAIHISSLFIILLSLKYSIYEFTMVWPFFLNVYALARVFAEYKIWILVNWVSEQKRMKLWRNVRVKDTKFEQLFDIFISYLSFEMHNAFVVGLYSVCIRVI